MEERLKKAMVDKVPLLNIHQISVAPNGFQEKAKWRLLEASEVVKEPECVDPTLVWHHQKQDAERIILI